MNVFDMLEKAGYEAQNIGSGLLPATLMHDGTPVGFLMPDLSLSLVTEHTQEREALGPLVQYCVDTQGLDAMTNGEAKLTQYENAVLTSSYDFVDRRPIYSLYAIDAEKNLTNVGIFYEKEQATRQFASFSGLVGETPAQGRTDKIKQFAQAIEKRGYKILDGEKKENRAFDIRDKDGNLVGYIGKDNRVTMVGNVLNL